MKPLIPLFTMLYGAYIYDQQGRAREALEHFSRYLELAGDNAYPEVIERIRELEAQIGTPVAA